jgi:hypothetical protein
MIHDRQVCLHVPVLYVAQARKRFGVQIQVIPETAKGDIDVHALQQLLAQQVGSLLHCGCRTVARQGLSHTMQACVRLLGDHHTPGPI